MKTYTDEQLKRTLSKMLVSPNTITLKIDNTWEWDKSDTEVLDTELLYLCWLAEETLKPLSLSVNASKEWVDYVWALGELNDVTKASNIHSAWQQRVIALAKVKGIEI